MRSSRRSRLALVPVRFWPAIAGISTAVAMLSSGFAVYTAWHLEEVLATRSDEQLRQLSDRMNDAITMATARADAGDAHLDKRIDVMKAKLDPLPGQVDAAVQDMRKQVTSAITTMKAAVQPLPTAAVTHDDAPGFKRKKAG